jgi:hypothetical protein
MSEVIRFRERTGVVQAAPIAKPKNGFKHFSKYIPNRQQATWKTDQPVPILCKCGLKQVAIGTLPIGLLNGKELILDDLSRLSILEKLSLIPDTKYNSTDPSQKVRSWGKPFVDSSTLQDYLEKEVSAEIKSISDPLVENLSTILKKHGFKVEVMYDINTGFPYSAGVFRAINVVNNASVLHVDDFIRDGSKKLDLRLPYPFMNNIPYYQVSFNYLLDDGGHDADSLFVHNSFYKPADEAAILPNGWQFPLERVAENMVCQFQPKVGDFYVFSTSCFHDVRGGSPLANRITWSVFGLYFPTLNMMYLYN